MVGVVSTENAFRCSVHYVAYGEYGGSLSLSPIGSFLGWTMRDSDFGLSELEVTIYFDRRRRIPGDTDEDYAQFVTYLHKLPKTKFEAAKRKLSVQYRSELKPVKEVLDAGELVPGVFRDALAEVISVLAAIEPKLRKKAGLNFPAFVEAAQRAAQSLPKTDGALRKLVEEASEREQALFAALPWDQQLDIDWSEFHPEAKTLLSNPFYWDCVDDNAPHGNDTGADLLELFTAWRARNKKTSPLRFLDRTLEEWGFGAALPAAPRATTDLPRATIELTQDEAAIALAFAMIKLEGACDAPTCAKALDAIKRQSDERTVATWNSPKERRTALKTMRRKLQEFAR
jgi:uncharacterized protein YfeS